MIKKMKRKKLPKPSVVYSPFLCDTCSTKECVFHIGDIKIPCANLKRGDNK